MTDTDTQAKRDLELEFYREKFTELANVSADDPVWAPLRQWAEKILRTGESITGPGVDMTPDERAAIIKLLED